METELRNKTERERKYLRNSARGTFLLASIYGLLQKRFQIPSYSVKRIAENIHNPKHQLICRKERPKADKSILAFGSENVFAEESEKNLSSTDKIRFQDFPKQRSIWKNFGFQVRNSASE
ncbi:hypothetical protein DLM75_12830 [Leptospira stimsonii]|uniref:Uncharacterized protein n=1 Tax=Leptospira stimsonii TaxID=2202203 RepID=A0A396Z7X6_9LEPT|nr:hypothetical protein DLM75_12830 [Leptospira stimsonii]